MNLRFPDILFTRNPIRLSEPRPVAPPGLRQFSVSVGGSVAYRGHCSSVDSVDVGDIAEAHVEPVPDPDGDAVDAYGILRKLEDSARFEGRLVSVTDSEGELLAADFYALPGGVSPQNYRRLSELDSDIFTDRLLDKRRNFFLTTRTHGWRIVIDEPELYPLAFVNLANEPVKLTLKGVGTDFTSPEIDIARGIYAIDIAAVRRSIAQEHRFLASAFDVYYGSYLSCQIVVRDAEPEHDMTLVKFRNSLGVFELVRLSGKKEGSAVPPEAGEDGCRYDAVTGQYPAFRDRDTLTGSVDVDTGFMAADRLRFVIDMVASEEVYMLVRTGWVRVIPSMEKLLIRTPQEKPESIKISFTIADSYDRLTPDIRDLDDFERPRIFSREHTDTFN